MTYTRITILMLQVFGKEQIESGVHHVHTKNILLNFGCCIDPGHNNAYHMRNQTFPNALPIDIDYNTLLSFTSCANYMFD